MLPIGSQIIFWSSTSIPKTQMYRLHHSNNIEGFQVETEFNFFSMMLIQFFLKLKCVLVEALFAKNYQLKYVWSILNIYLV